MIFDFSLSPGDAHVWRLDLAAAGTLCADTGHLPDLDASERARAEAFVFDRDRRRFVAGRRFLKALLGSYLGLPSSEISLRVGANGKPVLAQARPLAFNVSHSGDVYVVGITAGEEIGIDIELYRDMPDAYQLARTVFSPEEIAVLDGLEQPQAGVAFLQGWTRKEAFVKALGVGVGIELPAVTVGLDQADRIVAPITGISTEPFAIRSLPTHASELLALATHPDVVRIERRDISNARLVAELCL